IRVQIEAALIAGKGVRSLVDVDPRGIQQLSDRFQPGVERGEADAFAMRTCNQSSHAELAVAVEQIGEGGTSLLQLAGVGETPMSLLQLGQRLRIQGVVVQLGDLVAQPVHAFAMILAASDFPDPVYYRAPGCGEFPDPPQRFRVTAEDVEQGELLAAIEQGLMLVLAMDLDQSLAERFQLGQGDGPAIDPATRAAFAADDPAQLAGVAVVQLFLAQPVAQLGAPGQIEIGGELGALAAMPDQARIL